MNKDKYVAKLFAEQKRLNPVMSKPGVHDLVLVLDHLKPDFNIGKIYRSSDVFSIKEIHLVGIPFFDPIPSKGTFKRVKTFFYDTIAESLHSLREQGYEIFAMDSNEATILHHATLPKKCAFIFGSEGIGLTFSRADFPFVRGLKIEQFGLTESLNVSIAASIAMYEYIRQNPTNSSPA